MWTEIGHTPTMLETSQPVSLNTTVGIHIKGTSTKKVGGQTGNSLLCTDVAIDFKSMNSCLAMKCYIMHFQLPDTKSQGNVYLELLQQSLIQSLKYALT